MWNLTSEPLEHVTNNKVMIPDFDVVFPFPVAVDNDCLEKSVEYFDMNVYSERLQENYENMGLVFNGKMKIEVHCK